MSTNTPKTADEIQAEIDRLIEMKPRVRHFTAFGDNNHDKIDIEIAVLKAAKKEDDITKLYSDLDTEEYDPDEESIARFAYDWAQGHEDESPSQGWEPLLVEGKV